MAAQRRYFGILGKDLLADSDLIETFCENERDLGKMFRESLPPQPK
jgi:hypothetical protein